MPHSIVDIGPDLFRVGAINLNSRTIFERLAMLRAEIAQLRSAELNYRILRSKHPAKVKEHSDREVRIKEILDELASLMKKQD